MGAGRFSSPVLPRPAAPLSMAGVNRAAGSGTNDLFSGKAFGNGMLWWAPKVFSKRLSIRAGLVRRLQ
jgi:hypothetical protein